MGRCGLRSRVFGDEAGDGVVGQSRAAAGREQGAGVGAPVGGEPASQDADGERGQRGAAVLATFAAAVDMRADTELEIADDECGQFRDAESGLCGLREQGMIPAAVPVGGVGGGQQGIDFGRAEEADDRGGGSFGLDGQEPGEQVVLAPYRVISRSVKNACSSGASAVTVWSPRRGSAGLPGRGAARPGPAVAG
jgi:hypothetical protein